LITGSDDSPKSVSEKKLTGYPRGPLLGIPGAPAALPGPADTELSDWTVCDTVAAGQVTTVAAITTPELGTRIRAAGGGEAVLVSVGDEVHLVAGGTRSRIDVDSVPVRRALDIDDADVRPISPGVLNALPETDPIVAPSISNRGAPSALGRDIPIGAVIKGTTLTGESTFYVALAQGVQQIGEVAAEIIRQADPAGADSVPTVSPAQLTGVETVSVLPVDEFPMKAPRWTDVEADPVLCHAWSRSATDHEAHGQLLLGSTLPLGAREIPVVLAGADGPGPGLDAVFVEPGRGHYIQVTGSEPDSTRAESLFYVNDSGVRYGVSDVGTAAAIGLGDTPVPAPWSIVSLLAAGPTLSRDNALVSHDGMAPDPAAARIEPPTE
jgi:type VII secretion protein EccB